MSGVGEPDWCCAAATRPCPRHHHQEIAPEVNTERRTVAVPLWLCLLAVGYFAWRLLSDLVHLLAS